MSQEIERKFLVRDGFKAEAFKSVRIIQGYLSSVPERIVRVRVKDGRGYVTVKGLSDPSGVSRAEWEWEIPAGDALAMLAIAEPGVIDKTRHLVACADGRHVWEVDEFHGDNEGLVVAEIELGSEDEAFDRPDWLGDEVTGRPEYYNSSLAVRPYKDWRA